MRWPFVETEHLTGCFEVKKSESGYKNCTWSLEVIWVIWAMALVLNVSIWLQSFMDSSDFIVARFPAKTRDQKRASADCSTGFNDFFRPKIEGLYFKNLRPSFWGILLEFFHNSLHSLQKVNLKARTCEDPLLSRVFTMRWNPDIVIANSDQ